MTLRLAILPVMVLVLAACAGAATASVSSSPSNAPTIAVTATPTASLTATPSPSPDLAPLAATYSTIAAGGTAAIGQCDREKAAANGTLANAKAIAQACRDGYVKYIAALRAVDWGPVQAQADSVLSTAEACDALVRDMVDAASWSTFSAAYARLPAAEGRLVLSADAMRKALGLPPTG